MCGPTAAQTDLEESQASFYQTLQTQDETQYADEQDVLSQLKSTYTPILQAGSSQYGYTHAEDVDLNTEATEGVAQNYSAAKKALAENNAATGGGNSYLPSGVQSSEMASLDSSAAAQRSTEQLQIKQAGYQQGYQNFVNATGALESSAEIANPSAYASTANTAGSDEGTTASTIASENTAWMAPLTAAIGGVSSAATAKELQG